MAAGKKTGGRKKGVPNKASIERQLAVAESGLTPLDYMLEVMRDGTDPAQRLDAAKAAAPYVHPRLQPVDPKTGDAALRIVSLDDADRRA